MSYPRDWPEPGKMHFRLVHPRLGELNLGCDSGYVVTAYNLGFPEIREVKLNNSLDDGVFDVTRFFGARAVSLDVTLKRHTGLTPASNRTSSEAVLRDKLLGYLYPGIRPTLLFSEHDDPRVRQILLRGTSASLAVSQPDYNRVNASWLAPRGTLYAWDERCYQYRFGETSGEFMDLVIINEGTVPVDWRATISGYSVHPLFTLNGTETLSIEYDADPGDVITLDAFSRTITINGLPASYSYVGDASVWFKIPPGVNNLRVSHAGGVSAFGYPYARWQESGGSLILVSDLFDRADGPLGANWETPADTPAGTTTVDLAIEDNGVIVTEPDDGTGDREWGFARHVTEITGGTGTGAEMTLTNLGQSSRSGPLVRSKAELYTNMNDTDAACQALSVDFDFGILTAPVAPVVLQEPFETTDAWVIAGSNTQLVAGRNGQGVQIEGTITSLSYDLAVEAQSTIGVVGVAFKIVMTPGATAINNVRSLVEFRGNAGVTFYGRIGVDVGGMLFATDSLGVIKGSTPAGAVTPNTWHYAEVRYVLSPTDGEFALRLDGIDVAGAYGINTGIAGALLDQIRLAAPNTVSGGIQILDDLYLATGAEAAFLGPVTVPNGTLAWELHSYDAAGVTGTTAAAGALAYNYTGTTKVRLESSSEGEQRFLLDGVPIVEATEVTPVVGTQVGFGLSYETFEYPLLGAVDFRDDFERAALGTDWVLPVARTATTTTVLPTINAGDAIASSHTAAYPTWYNNGLTSGASLLAGVVQTLPSYQTGQLAIAQVLQDRPNGEAKPVASAGWTEVATVTQGTYGGDFMEAFDHFGAWTTAGTAAIVTSGRTATNAGRLTGVGSSNHADFVFARNPVMTPENATVIIGFAFQISSLTAAVSELVQFYSDTNATQHGRVTVNTDGSLSYYRGTTLLGAPTAAGLIAINTWNYLEVRTVLSDTVGEVTLRLNGTDVLTLTAQDTQNGGTKTVYDTVRLCGPIASMFNTFDDCYIVTGTSAAFKGDQAIAVSSGIQFLRLTAFVRVLDNTSSDALTLTGANVPFATAITCFNSAAGFAGDYLTSKLVSATASGATATGFPDPPAIDIGGTKDEMFFVVGGVSHTTTPSMTQSSGYSNTYSTHPSLGNLSALRAGHRTAVVGGIENPVAFTGTTGRPWVAMTFGFSGGSQKWGAAERINEFSGTNTVAAEAVVTSASTSGSPLVELYTHMVSGSPTCRALQVDPIARTWKMGHYTAGTPVLVVAASGAWPTGGYGPEQRITVPGTPDLTTYTGEVGLNLQFSRPGRITKIRYYRTATTSTTVNLNVWDNAGTRVAGPISDSTGAGTDGYQEVTLPTPLTVTNGQNYTFSLGGVAGGPVPGRSGAYIAIPSTTDCVVFTAELHNNTVGTRPNSSGSVGYPYVEPTYEPLLNAAPPWRLRLEGDPDGTERFLFNNVLVNETLDATAPTPVGVATRVGFGEFWVSPTQTSPRINEFSGVGVPFLAGPPPPVPTSPRVELFAAKPLSGTDWAIPDLVVPLTDPTKPRDGAQRVESNYWAMIGVVPNPDSPGGAAFVSYDGAGSGMFLWADGWTYDGLGWRDEFGHHAYSDGAIIRAVSNLPLNNPPPGGKPPWAWTPPVDPLTGEPSILTVHFCYYDQWI